MFKNEDIGVQISEYKSQSANITLVFYKPKTLFEFKNLIFAIHGVQISAVAPVNRLTMLVTLFDQLLHVIPFSFSAYQDPSHQNSYEIQIR